MTNRRSSAATEPVQEQGPKELYLYVMWDLEGNFELDRRWYAPNPLLDSVLTVDYSFRPWPLCSGNLLW